MANIFLSHSSEDKEFVRIIANRLRNYHIKVWIDEAEIQIGDSLDEKIESGIEKVDFLGLVLSPNSIKSEWVTKEINMAMNASSNGKNIKILPLLYKKCKMPKFLDGKLYGDFTSKNKYEESFSKLLRTLEIDPKDSQRTNGEICMIENDFRQYIEKYFYEKDIELKYYEDLSGIEYIKVNITDTIFTFYSYWTKPTIAELLDDIFKVDSRRIKGIEFIDYHIYKEEDKEEFLNGLLIKYNLPKDSYPGQWTSFSEEGKIAMNKWVEWLGERQVITFLFK